MGVASTECVVNRTRVREMLSRRRCCINAISLLILTLLSALILVWSSTVTNQKLQILHSREPDNGASDNSNFVAESFFSTRSSRLRFSHSVSTVDSHNTSLSPQKRSVIPNSTEKLLSISRELLMRFPQVMIIGFGKAGTKALYEALKIHPQLSGSYREKRFFSQHYSIGLENYLRSLPEPPDGGFNTEKSPDYIIVPAASKRIKLASSVPEIGSHKLRFVVVLRDPVDRAMSEYLEWNIQRKSLNRPKLPSFEDMVIDKNGNVDELQPFINASCYAYHIQNWLKYFLEDQMCYVDGDEFVVNPLKEMLMLEACLQLEHYFSERNFVYDEGRGFFCFHDPKLVNSSMCMNKSKGRKHPDIPMHVEKLLRSYFHPWNSRLPGMIGRNIAWIK